mgnify:CR=1 FL=1
METREQLIKVIDFWKKNITKKGLQPRSVISRIDFKNREIVDLVGPRRSGKSSTMGLIIQKLKIKDNFLYINFEDPFFIENNNPQIIEDLIDAFKENFNLKLKYLFFDEIQEIKNWEKALRKLRDGENFKIFITGSSSKMLSGEISSLITGRHLSYNIFPLSFSEFLFFKGLKVETLKDVVLNKEKIKKLFSRYLEVGGFPEVVLTGNQSILKNYFYDILQKDIIKRYDVRDKNSLERIAVFSLTNSGKTITVESLKKAYNISFETASAYLDYFKEVFLVFELTQFSYSLKKQDKALKKIYAVDCGLAGSVSFRFSQDLGRILETVVFLELKNRGKEIFYYKNKDGKETDFLIRDKGRNRELIQVCFDLTDPKTAQREIANLSKSMDELNLKKGLILTREEKKTIKLSEGREINILPVYEWMLER